MPLLLLLVPYKINLAPRAEAAIKTVQDALIPISNSGGF